MTKITIIAEDTDSPDAGFCASYRGQEFVGRTAGAALDALTAQIPESDSGTLVVIQNLRPDVYFDASKRLRLKELLDLRRALELSNQKISVNEQAELEMLVNDELNGSEKRAEAMA